MIGLSLKAESFWQTSTSFLKTEEEELISLLTFPFTFLNLSVRMPTASAGQPPLQGKISMNHQLWMKEISSNWWGSYRLEWHSSPIKFPPVLSVFKKFRPSHSNKNKLLAPLLKGWAKQIIIIFLPHGFAKTARGGAGVGRKQRNLFKCNKHVIEGLPTIYLFKEHWISITCLPHGYQELKDDIKKQSLGDFIGGPVIKTLTSKAGVQVRSWVWELGSHMPHGQKKKLK